MKKVMNATTLESRFPLLAVEHGCIISKDADITAAFEVELPEVYTVTAEEYEGIHATWCKAIKVLPDYSVLHKQDWYVKEEYRPDWQKTGTGFLARSNGMHFNERPYLNHKCYLFLTKTTRERMRRQSNWSTLCRGHIVPKEIRDRETAVKFMEAVEQFARILNDSGHIRLRRLSDDELAGTEKETGIVGRYLALSPGNTDCLEDIAMSAENIDLLHKRFVVFEIDAVKDNAELFPVVTIIIMEAFINKMRRLKGVRKQLICEEAWKALSSANMASYLQYLYKTVRKYFGEAIVVTQEVDDIISSPIVKESIINNSDCKILLDQRKYMNRFDQIQSLLGLTEKEKSQILSINQSNDPSRRYKEVWIGLGGTHSAVYATEVSMHEYLAYTTEETEKTEVRALAGKLGGDMEAAIRQVAERQKE